MSLLKRLANDLKDKTQEPISDREIEPSVSKPGEYGSPKEKVEERFCFMTRKDNLRAYCENLDWGKLGCPAYLDQFDCLYEIGGSEREPRFYLACLPARPVWHNELLRAPGDPTRDNCPDCCYECGRRLFYRTREGVEHCLTCKPINPRQKQFEEEEDPDDFGNVFFLKAGVGLDW